MLCLFIIIKMEVMYKNALLHFRSENYTGGLPLFFFPFPFCFYWKVKMLSIQSMAGFENFRPEETGSAMTLTNFAL